MSGYRSSEREIGSWAREPLREVVSLEQLRDGQGARQPHHLGVREGAEPLAVVPDLRALAVENPEGLLGERARVRVEHLVGEDRTLLRASRRVADPGRVVADDQHHRVTFELELGQAVEDAGEPEVNVGRLSGRRRA